MAYKHLTFPENSLFLVTGGAGFIGSNFMHYEVKNYPNDVFVCLDSLTYAGNYNNIKDLEGYDNVKFVKGDITAREAVFKLFEEEKFHIVINLFSSFNMYITNHTFSYNISD